MALNGQFLDGAMFANYITKLVEKINEGAVPNIEETFTYICRAKCN